MLLLLLYFISFKLILFKIYCICFFFMSNLFGDHVRGENVVHNRDEVDLIRTNFNVSEENNDLIELENTSNKTWWWKKQTLWLTFFNSVDFLIFKKIKLCLINQYYYSTPETTGDFSLISEWQQVSSAFQDSPRYLSQPQQFCSLDILSSFLDF